MEATAKEGSGSAEEGLEAKETAGLLAVTEAEKKAYLTRAAEKAEAEQMGAKKRQAQAGWAAAGWPALATAATAMEGTDWVVAG